MAADCLAATLGRRQGRSHENTTPNAKLRYYRLPICAESQLACATRKRHLLDTAHVLRVDCHPSGLNGRLHHSVHILEAPEDCQCRSTYATRAVERSGFVQIHIRLTAARGFEYIYLFYFHYLSMPQPCPRPHSSKKKKIPSVVKLLGAGGKRLP